MKLLPLGGMGCIAAESSFYRVCSGLTCTTNAWIQLVRVSMVQTPGSEETIWIQRPTMKKDGRFGETICIVANGTQQMCKNAVRAFSV